MLILNLNYSTFLGKCKRFYQVKLFLFSFIFPISNFFSKIFQVESPGLYDIMESMNYVRHFTQTIKNAASCPSCRES